MTDASKAVKLAGRLPGSTEHNGMSAVVRDLLTEPETTRLAVIEYDVPKIVTDVETGDRVPTLRVLRIEPAGGDKEEGYRALRELMLSAAENRLGHTPLPFDEVDGVAVLEGEND
ncbi:hypothetical protein ACXJJ3_26735 [Kribbella sp. WER1]